jgi:hypothetical protein
VGEVSEADRELLERLGALKAKATPGPFEALGSAVWRADGGTFDEADAEYIAAVLNAAPRLLGMARRSVRRCEARPYGCATHGAAGERLRPGEECAYVDGLTPAERRRILEWQRG